MLFVVESWLWEGDFRIPLLDELDDWDDVDVDVVFSASWRYSLWLQWRHMNVVISELKCV